jgi:predicted dehydrogenase
MIPYNVNKLHYNWHWSRNFGTGEMGNWGAHWLDVARWLADLDLPSAVMGSGGQYVMHDAKEWPDTQTVIYEFPNHVTMLWELRLWTKRGMNDRGSGAEINGSNGSIVIDRRGWTFYPKDGEPVVHERSELEQAHALAFAKAIRDEARPTASMEDGHKSAILCHLGNVAATVNRRLAFDAATETIIDDPEAQALCARENRAPWNV